MLPNSFEMIGIMSASWSRRTLVTVLACGTTGLLSGCEGGPSADVEVGPTDGTGRPIRSKAADVPLLVTVLQRTRYLLSLGRDLGPGDQSRLLREAQTAHGLQADVLERLLQAARVDPGAASIPPDAGATTTAGSMPADAGAAATATATPPSRAQRIVTLRSALADDVAGRQLRSLAKASAANLPMLVSVYGERGASAMLLGARVPWPPLSGPSGADAIGVLGGLRPAVYALEVAAARSSAAERERYEAALAPLGKLTRQVTELAGAAAPVAPLGYGLPGPLTTRAQRTDLVAAALRPLPAAVVAGTGGLTGDRAAIFGSVRLLAEVLRVGHPFGLPVTGFPGMSVP